MIGGVNSVVEVKVEEEAKGSRFNQGNTRLEEDLSLKEIRSD